MLDYGHDNFIFNTSKIFKIRKHILDMIAWEVKIFESYLFLRLIFRYAIDIVMVKTMKVFLQPRSFRFDLSRKSAFMHFLNIFVSSLTTVTFKLNLVLVI